MLEVCPLILDPIVPKEDKADTIGDWSYVSYLASVALSGVADCGNDNATQIWEPQCGRQMIKKEEYKESEEEDNSGWMKLFGGLAIVAAAGTAVWMSQNHKKGDDRK